MSTPNPRTTPIPGRSPTTASAGPRSPPLSIRSPSFLSTPSPGKSASHMPASLGTSDTGQAHLVSLVLQSKKALQHGEQLCTRAHTASNASAQATVDVLALDAKIKWMVDAVVEQLKLAASVAKGIEEKRTHLRKQIDEWDASRAKHADALDAVLESLGSQLVPPEFYQTSSDSSLFGSQHGSDNEQDPNVINGGIFSDPSINHSGNGTVGMPSPVSPSATLRGKDIGRIISPKPSGALGFDADPKGKEKRQESRSRSRNEDRSYWKTLRDFVDDKSIEDALDMIENDRLALDTILNKTVDYPETLTKTINSIQASLPVPESGSPRALKRVQDIASSQESLVRNMASVLENLVNHYENMENTLKESESGVVFTDEELVVMNRDTDELPTIMSEMERDMKAIEEFCTQLNTMKDSFGQDLQHLASVVNKLEELGEILEEMLRIQNSVEIQVEAELNGLQEHLTTLRDLHEQFVSYRMAFNKLILEISRRRQYREAAENIVKGMMRQLDSMSEEENRVRAHFNAEYGSHLPEDICLCIRNEPTKWEVVPSEGSYPEVLPVIANDLITGARERVGYSPRQAGADI